MAFCELPAPLDTITDLCFSSNIYVSSWDKSVSVYGDSYHVIQTDTPVLRLECDNCVFTGSADGKVNIYTLDLSPIKQINTDLGGIQMLHRHNNVIIAGGWNKKICTFDLNGKVEQTIKANTDINYFRYKSNKVTSCLDISPSPETCTSCLSTEGKIYCSDLKNESLLIGMGDTVIAYDLRTFEAFYRKKYTTAVRSLALAEEGYYAGFMNGKIRFETFPGFKNEQSAKGFKDAADKNRNDGAENKYEPKTNTNQSKKLEKNLTNDSESKQLIFNAHFDSTQVFYPVNCLKYNGKLFSGGSDGRVYKWTNKCKKIIENEIGIVALDIRDNLMAVGCSYNYYRGKVDTSKNKIFVKKI